MIAALPAGWLADKYRRDRILKVAAVLGALSGVGLSVTLVDALPMKALFAATALMGCYTGFNNAPLEALFSDCIPRGRRYATGCALCTADVTTFAAMTVLEGCTAQGQELHHCTYLSAV